MNPSLAGHPVRPGGSAAQHRALSSPLTDAHDTRPTITTTDPCKQTPTSI